MRTASSWWLLGNFKWFSNYNLNSWVELDSVEMKMKFFGGNDWLPSSQSLLLFIGPLLGRRSFTKITSKSPHFNITLWYQWRRKFNYYCCRHKVFALAVEKSNNTNSSRSLPNTSRRPENTAMRTALGLYTVSSCTQHEIIGKLITNGFALSTWARCVFDG